MSGFEINEEEEIEKVRAQLAGSGTGRESLIPARQKIQAVLGYISPGAMLEAAKHFCVPAVDIYGIVTFYNHFRLVPPGRHRVKLCMGTACHMKNGETIKESWERALKIKVGETTPNREYSLERVACVGCCNLAPVVVIDDNVHGKMTPTGVDGLIFSSRLAEQQERKSAQDEQH